MKDSMFNLQRLIAITIKEFQQISRDKPSVAMMVGIPILQLILFGFAINTNPKNLPTAIVAADHSPQTRSFLKALENTDYFRFIEPPMSHDKADALMKKGKVQFIVTIPQNFTRKLIRQEKPSLLVEVDATDPVASANAITALEKLAVKIFAPTTNKISLITHLKYNPEIITQYNIVPGLLGVILTMTMVFITALAITRERERGTMENLLATPVYPAEVIVGKIIPYIMIGYVQVSLILTAAHQLFHVPISGNILLLFLLCLPFIAANLTVGLMFSTIAHNQLQAVMSSVFFFLPSILLSGFMFPFYGMPLWAQSIGEVLPLTHFLRIIRGILLKDNGFTIIWPELWPILLFTLVMILIGIKRFRRTLD